MTAWTFFGWCMAIGVGVPVAMFGLFFVGAIGALIVDSVLDWLRRKVLPKRSKT